MRAAREVAHDALERSITMNRTTAPPAQLLPSSSLTAEFDTPSKTTARSNRCRQDCPPRMLPSEDWSEFLTLDEMCDRYIRWMLDRCGGNRVAAAQFLGIGRTTLYRYLKKADCEKRDNDWPQ